jgi:hypothetical protein
VGNYSIRPSLPEDAKLILPDIRSVDRDEWHVSVKGGVAENLEVSIIRSSECWTVVDAEGQPQVISGVVAYPRPQLPQTWMLGTDISDRDALALLYSFKAVFEGVFERWPRTECYSDVRNTQHHRWLEWLGYRLQGVRPWGPYNKPFHHYIKEPA